MHTWQKVFLSTLSLRRATPRGGFCYLDNIISIHALLAESDQVKQTYQAKISISIHALLAESDGNGLVFLGLPQGFLSTLSLRRATFFDVGALPFNAISIHALLAESDAPATSEPRIQPTFLSTLSLRRATVSPSSVGNSAMISIHALLAESDRLPLRPRAQRDRISIHALLAESDSAVLR